MAYPDIVLALAMATRYPPPPDLMRRRSFPPLDLAVHTATVNTCRQGRSRPWATRSPGLFLERQALTRLAFRRPWCRAHPSGAAGHRRARPPAHGRHPRGAQEAVTARLGRDGLSNRRSAAGCSSVPGPCSTTCTRSLPGSRSARAACWIASGPATRPPARSSPVDRVTTGGSAGQWRMRTTPCQPLTPRGGGGVRCRMRKRQGGQRCAAASVGSSREPADSAEARCGRRSRPPDVAGDGQQHRPCARQDPARTSDSAASWAAPEARSCRCQYGSTRRRGAVR
jgi:hypothetical protein